MDIYIWQIADSLNELTCVYVCVYVVYIDAGKLSFELHLEETYCTARCVPRTQVRIMYSMVNGVLSYRPRCGWTLGDFVRKGELC